MSDFDWHRSEGYQYGPVIALPRVDEPRPLLPAELEAADEYQLRAAAALLTLAHQRFPQVVTADEHIEGDPDELPSRVVTTYQHGRDMYRLVMKPPDHTNDGTGGCMWLVVASPRRGSFAFAATASLLFTRDPLNSDALNTPLDLDIHADLITAVLRLERARRLPHSSVTALTLLRLEEILVAADERIRHQYLGYLIIPRVVWGGLAAEWPPALGG